MERYSEYKESGVKWLGEIPSHWEVVPIKHGYKFTVGWTPPTGRNDLFEGNNLWANISDLGDKVIRTTTNHISDSAVRQSGRSISPKGSLLYSFKLSVGTVSFCGADMYTNEAIATFLKGKNSLEFLYYAAPIFIIKNANTNIYGAPILNQDLIKNALVLLPPLSEQDAIVRYLDSATSEIDKAIAMQQKMIDLLNERKQIIIQNAVTKGLDENVEMKESGVEWIGRIPKHWEVEPFNRHFTFGKGLPITKANLQEEGIAVISYGQIHAKNNLGTTLTESLVRYVSPTYIETHPQCLLKGNDFIFADTSEDIEGSGNFAFNDFDNKIFAGYHTVVARPNDLLFPKYYAYLFKSKAWKSQIQSLVNGVKVYSIGRRILKTSMLLIPSEDEQKNIVKFLDKQTSAIEKTIETISRQITLLQERKQIIINEVVTGKVRVS